MTIRGTLLGIGILFWLGAFGCWWRARGNGRLSREGLLFLILGLPFFAAGGFYTSSSYPGEVIAQTPAPAPTPPVAIIATPVAATPAPAPAAAPPTYSEAVLNAQRAAVARYPALGKAGTPFNTKFLAVHRQRRFENPTYFDDPEWPLRLADEVAAIFRKSGEP
ncbi:MAG: hypothetical protein QOE70_6876 [Chthoniobacter sp.]|nr:hypothetical protein [Chthoniobacter sp.]